MPDEVRKLVTPTATKEEIATAEKEVHFCGMRVENIELKAIVLQDQHPKAVEALKQAKAELARLTAEAK
jgi:hypothetical protein